MRQASHFCLLGLLVCGSSSLWALTPLEMHDLHLRAERGGLTEANDCVAQLEAEVKRRPMNQLARVYLGSANTLKSRSEGLGPEKLRTLLRGGELMNAAVDAAPNDPRVRLIRATNFLQLPAIFGKRSAACADFDLLLAAAADSKNDLLPDERAAIYYFGGQSLASRSRKAEAVNAWKTGMALVESKVLAALLLSRVSENTR